MSAHRDTDNIQVTDAIMVHVNRDTRRVVVHEGDEVLIVLTTDETFALSNALTEALDRMEA